MGALAPKSSLLSERKNKTKTKQNNNTTTNNIVSLASKMERAYRCAKQKFMGIGAGGIAAITAAGAVVSQGANAYAVGRMNRKNRKFAEHMYDIQRKAALADWENTNTYNSPVEQMKRLKAAGLNPNLVYGNGTDLQASPIRGADFDQPNTAAPQFENPVPEALNKYQQVSLQKQQIDNMKATEELIKAQTQATLANAGLKNIQLDVEGKAFEQGTSDAERLAKYQKTAADAETAHNKMRSSLVEAEVKEATQQSTVTLAAEKIIQMRIQNAKTEEERKNLAERLRILKAEGTLKELDAEFAEKMNKRWDGYLLKVLGALLGKSN